MSIILCGTLEQSSIICLLFIHLDLALGNLGGIFTLGQLTGVTVHPDIIHMKHCAYGHCSLKILPIAKLFTNNIDTIH